MKISTCPVSGLLKRPATITSILEALRYGRGLVSCLNCVGFKNESFTFTYPLGGQMDGECRGCNGKFDSETNSLEYSVGVEFSVNGKHGENWRMAVVYTPVDDYEIWVWSPSVGLLRKVDMVYAFDLDDKVVEAYDACLNEYNGGFIPEPQEGDV